MPRHEETRNLPYDAEQMYAVVADIERYPEFLPWCVSVKTLSRETRDEKTFLTAEMVVAYHGVRERYTSGVHLDPASRTIEAHHLEGPFEHLDSKWDFTPLPTGSRVHFVMDFAFRNWLLSAIAGIAFDMAARHMADAFCRRAEHLHGRLDRLTQQA